jgi:hypothetical protein
MTISEIIQKNVNLIIWDNFPLGLTDRSLNYSTETFHYFCTSNIENKIISLNSKFLPLNFHKIALESPDFYSFEIKYNRELFGEIFMKYISHIKNFALVFDINYNYSEVIDILWKKEPIPLEYWNSLNTF